MNKLIRVIVICFMSLAFISITHAAETKDATKAAKPVKATSKKWVCETNASSSSTEADKKADETMKKASAGKSAFDFALKHCRDCTKITCTMEE